VHLRFAAIALPLGAISCREKNAQLTRYSLPSEVETSHYVLTVDLWSADGTREVNLVRHSATSPSISAATSSSYPPPPPTPPPHPHPQAHHPHRAQQQQHPGYAHSSMHTQISYPGYPPPPPTPPSQLPQQNYYQPPQQQHPGGPGYYQSIHGSLPASVQQQPPPPPQQQTQQTPSGMFTRNLIGSLTASAFKLTDPDNKIGVWFILQDLSVRTEGSFRCAAETQSFTVQLTLTVHPFSRLKMNFVNVGRGDGKLNTGVAPVLATAYSDVFQVYSAKKFPGVIESTGLSKCFAMQGRPIFPAHFLAERGLTDHPRHQDPNPTRQGGRTGNVIHKLAWLGRVLLYEGTESLGWAFYCFFYCFWVGFIYCEYIVSILTSFPLASVYYCLEFHQGIKICVLEDTKWLCSTLCME